MCLGIAPDSMPNLGRIWSGLAGRMEGDDLPFADRGGQVVGEGRDAALARRRLVLVAQFSAMEAAIATLKQQSAALLGTNSSTSSSSSSSSGSSLGG